MASKYGPSMRPRKHPCLNFFARIETERASRLNFHASARLARPSQTVDAATSKTLIRRRLRVVSMSLCNTQMEPHLQMKTKARITCRGHVSRSTVRATCRPNAAKQMRSPEKATSNQRIRWCCIDRLSRQPLPDKWLFTTEGCASGVLVPSRSAKTNENERYYCDVVACRLRCRGLSLACREQPQTECGSYGDIARRQLL